MNIGMAFGIIREIIMYILIISGVIVLPSFVVTLLISIFQATTSIQEQTLTFIPKIVITLLIILFGGQLIITKLAGELTTIFTAISNI